MNGNVNAIENKNKGNSTPKPKAKNNEEKNKKSNALKDSKKINLSTRGVKKEVGSNEKYTDKGKENIDAMADFEVEEGILFAPAIELFR